MAQNEKQLSLKLQKSPSPEKKTIDFLKELVKEPSLSQFTLLSELQNHKIIITFGKITIE